MSKQSQVIIEYAQVKGITNSLNYLHENNVIHGDLKSVSGFQPPFAWISHHTHWQANVVISSDGIPLLMDFGISHLLAGTSTVETATSGSKGSLRWQAPELVLNEDPEDDMHTEASDIWALGMVYLVSVPPDGATG